MLNIYTEENGNYFIDCTKAAWSTNGINEACHRAGLDLSDVDFVIESNSGLILLVEYKNAAVAAASHPERFRPSSDEAIRKVSRKYYDSLHYLLLKGKLRSNRLVYIVESPYVDSVIRKRIRDRLKNKLPFSLQTQISGSTRLIEEVAVVSIDEWNNDPVYGNYPIARISGEIMTGSYLQEKIQEE